MSNSIVTQAFGDDATSIAERISLRDHTLWSDSPDEVSNRLGWLDIASRMQGEIADLAAVADSIKADGFTNAVLLGMGGSSLGPEVLRRSIGSAAGFPTLRVVDSTSPEVITALRSEIDLATTLFIVSSKSGSTIEPNALYAYFRDALEVTVGSSAGSHFVAVTDAGSSLEALGMDAGFRRIFIADPNIGGRYSVLSHFGLVPAAIAGVDISRLLDSAVVIEQQLQPEADVNESLAWRIAAELTLAHRSGRDKITFIEDGNSNGFGLWAEQLLAESLGKDALGLIPIANEPKLRDNAYGGDRIAARIGSGGSPRDVPEIDSTISDPYELGGLFLAWEYATAILGVDLGIQPFNQPDVQAAKDATNRVLAGPDRVSLVSISSLDELLGKRRTGDYLAIMAFVPETDEINEVLIELRRRVSERTGIATTLGYGPRFLHSTGQLHKGGPNNILAFQITQGHEDNAYVPGRNFGFAELIDAQAAGDFDALVNAGRRVARAHLAGDVTTELRTLTDSI
ncbi:MAG: glucose-6-phosphate isomerase [Chloroflexi bacterium]|nr:glucose-6-phosphate isomerase [Chloroflexota bacterium]